MDNVLKTFYDDNFIPAHIRLLLGLHGVMYLRDLTDFEAGDTEEIEQSIQSGGYSDKVDSGESGDRI